MLLMTGYSLRDTVSSMEVQTSFFQIMQTSFFSFSFFEVRFAGFLVPLCLKRALVWGTVVRGFARRDLC